MSETKKINLGQLSPDILNRLYFVGNHRDQEKLDDLTEFFNLVLKVLNTSDRSYRTVFPNGAVVELTQEELNNLENMVLDNTFVAILQAEVKEDAN